MSEVATAGLIERLLADELESLASEVAAGRQTHILKTLDERGIAQELIRQQYSGRYPFELLQNANDAMATTAPGTVARRVLLAVTEMALIVADTGTGFGADEVHAICGLGRSSKDPRKTIGYKGLGFKSVGEITRRPQIVSGPFRFTFDAGRVRSEVEAVTGPLPDRQRLPIYAFPFPLSRSDLGRDADLVDGLVSEGFASVVRLPFAEDVKRDTVARDVLSTVTPRLLLLLDSTDRLEVRGTHGDFVCTRRPPEQQGEAAEVLLEIDDTTERWLTNVLEDAPSTRHRARGGSR